MDFTVSHPFIQKYLQYVEHTESPRIMHIWSAISGISACMGRRCWLPYGPEEVFPNMYVILVGPPAVRKSTAFKIMCKFLRNSTGVRFAPDDTGGQRQGLISAMMRVTEDGETDEDKEIIARLAADSKEIKRNPSTVTLADLENTLADLGTVHIDTRDPRTMFIAASELNSILGEGNTALLTFLQKMFDGDPYDYGLKDKSKVLKDALLGLIGATTPGQIAIALPAEAIGQGFTSRAIFVFADKKHTRKIARPSLDESMKSELSTIYARTFNELNGAFIEHPNSARKMDELYERGIVIKDPRFVHYADRRHTHLQKLSMALAATRGKQEILEEDVVFADQLLLYTEEFMPDALGEYGMNKLGAAKQRLMDMVKNSTDAIPRGMLFGMLSRDMGKLDFDNCLVELHNAKKLTLTTLPNLGPCVIGIADTAARKAKKDLSQIEQLMMRAH